MPKLSPAETVIKAFGGVRPLARVIGRSPMAVSLWKKTGRVPSTLQLKILAAAQEQGLKITAADLVHGRNE